MKTIYPDVFEKVLFVCDQYIEGKCDTKKVHQVVSWAETCITNFAEKDLRNFFTKIEGDIDTIRVMANETDFEYKSIREFEDRESMLKVINEIKENLL